MQIDINIDFCATEYQFNLDDKLPYAMWIKDEGVYCGRHTWLLSKAN